MIQSSRPLMGYRMKHAHAAAQDAAVAESTKAYVAVSGQQPRSPCRKVGFVAGSTPHATSQMASLLRNRLRAFGLIFVAAFALFLFRNLVLDGLRAPVLLLAHIATLALLSVLTAFLFRPSPRSVRELRLVELGLFGVSAAFFTWLDVSWINSQQWQNPDGLVLPWFCLTVAYGVFIPNTWKRCTVIVLLFSLAPAAIVAVSAVIFRSMELAQLPAMLLEIGVRMATAAAIAIYGAYKIGALRTEAFEAKQLGQYRLKEKLGEGGMGEVYLAEHQLLRRPCAIKLIRPDQTCDEQSLQRFEREVQSMATLTHWNTVEIFDYGHTSDGTFYYVMEYLPGMSLEELVERHGPLPPERTAHLLRQVCAALHEAHGIGLIHRDIKPSNVFVCERGGVYDVVKLFDFGIVQLADGRQRDSRITSPGAVVGTPLFMSPEQATGKGELDARSDIYSVGAMAYFLLTGQPPFLRDTPMEVLAAHLKEEVVVPGALRADLPHDLQDIVLRCLEKDPAGRFPSARSLAQALAECSCAERWTGERAEHWWAQNATQHQRLLVEEAPAKDKVTAS